MHTHVEDLSNRSSSVSGPRSSPAVFHALDLHDWLIRDTTKNNAVLHPVACYFSDEADSLRGDRERCWCSDGSSFWICIPVSPRLSGLRNVCLQVAGLVRTTQGLIRKCKYLHVRAAASEGEYSLFQVIAPIYRGGVLACYASDTLSCHRQILFSPPLCRSLARGSANVRTICVWMERTV